MRSAHALVVLVPTLAAADPPGGTWLTTQSSLDVDEVRILVRCTEENRRAGCVVSETYTLHNPTAADVTTAGAFYGSSAATVAVGGKNAQDEGAPGAFDALDRMVQETPNTGESGRADISHTRFSVTVPAGARASFTT